MPIRSLVFRFWLASCGLAPSMAAQTATVMGRAIDVESARPLADVEVGVMSSEGAFLPLGRSNPWGRFRVPVPEGVQTLAFRRVGYRPEQVTLSLTDRPTSEMWVYMRADPFHLPEVVVVSGQPETEHDAPGFVEVIEPRVERTTALVPTGYLRGRTGMDVSRTGLFSETVVGRGFSSIFSTALLVITDHRYTSLPSLRGNVAFLMPAIGDDIERIEIMPGPASVLYGPNAANGVVNTITRSPFSSAGTAVTIGGGERELAFGSVRHAGILGGRLGYKVTAQYMTGREWRFTDPEETVPRDEHLRRWSAEVRIDYRPDSSSTRVATLTAGRVSAPRAIENTPFGAAQGVGWDFAYYQARYATPRLAVQAFLNTSDAGSSFWLRSGDTIRDESRLLAVQARHLSDIDDRVNLIYGIDYQHTDPRTFGTIHGRFEDDDGSDEIGAYLHSKIRLGRRIDALLATRYDRHSRVEKSIFSPRVGLVFKPSESQSLRVTYNRAFGTPLGSELLIDLLVDRAGPYEVRAIGTADGLRFRRDCPGGLCVRSPFPVNGEAQGDPTQPRDADATRFWEAAVQALYASAGIDIRGIPVPPSGQVSTAFRLLSPGGVFRTIDPASLTDIPRLRQTISHTYELGYKGTIGNRVRVDVDVWRQRRVNFVATALVQTPSIFLERASLTQYLSNFMSPDQAGQVAAALAGIDGDSDLTGLPLATVGLDHPYASDPHIYAANRNFGEVRLWGSDVSFEAFLTDRLTLTGNYSWLSDNTFRTAGAAGEASEVVINSPRNKGTLGLKWGTRSGALSVNARTRFVEGFPMSSAAYEGYVPGHTTVDLGMSVLVPSLRNTLIVLQVQNVFDNEHQEFLGAPEIGRLATTRLTYTF